MRRKEVFQKKTKAPAAQRKSVGRNEKAKA